MRTLFDSLLVHWQKSKLLRFTILFSLGCHVLAIFCSQGFHHPDEQYQILEWAALKLGITEPHHLAWEYKAHIRPWLQPWVVLGLLKTFSWLGITDPFWAATGLRFFSCLLSLLALGSLSLATLRVFENKFQAQHWALVLLWGLWFFPYQNVRPSSENWAGCFFWIAICLLYLRPIESQHKKLSFFIGTLLGLSFEMRYQMGISIFVLFVWLGITSFQHLKKVLICFLGLMVVLALCLLVDRWGYGYWVFPPWHYLKVNLFESKAAEFGVSPWWNYFQLFSLRAVPPLSLILLGLTLVAWLKRPLLLFSLLSWTFFLVHSGIGHKEMRFLFPLSFSLPWLVVLGMREMLAAWGPERSKQLAHVFKSPKIQALVSLLLILNFILMFASSIRPARSEIPFFEKMSGLGVQNLWAKKDIYDLIGLRGMFYRPKGLEITYYDNLDALHALPGPQFVHLEGTADWSQLERLQCQVKLSSPPLWTLHPPWLWAVKKAKIRVWSLWTCP